MTKDSFFAFWDLLIWNSNVSAGKLEYNQDQEFLLTINAL